MPEKGEKLDELLSGYLDSQLTAEELREVTAILEGSDSARHQLAVLRKNQESLQALAATRSARLPTDFGKRVLAQARQQQGATELDSKPAHQRIGRWMQVAAAVAAMLLLAISIGSWMRHGDETELIADGGGSLPGALAEAERDRTDDPVQGNGVNGSAPLLADASSTADVSSEENSAEPTSGVRYVSEVYQQILFAYVLEVTPTEAAYRNRLVEQILLQAGVSPTPPIVANVDVEKALEQSKMILGGPDEETSRAAIYFVHAETAAFDAAAKMMLKDTVNFPRAVHNIAMDNPQTRLMSKVAQSTGKRFAANKSFAAPLVFTQDSGELRPVVAGLPKLVSLGKREEGLGDVATLAAGPKQFSPVLLVVRIPQDAPVESPGN